MPEITLDQYNLLRKDVEKIYRKLVEMSDNAELGILSGDLDDSVWEHTITEVVAGVTLDNISDGEMYSKILSEAVQNALPLLSKAVGDLDDIIDGDTYGRVRVTALSAGEILLAQAIGDLDDIANGTDYGKVALTSISAGKIVVAGLDSNVTDRMFTDGNTKDNVEAWKHATDVTMIDGGKIYTGSITATQIAAGTITADELAANAVTTDKILADAVTASKINVDSLAAITATLGTVHAGTIYGTRLQVGGSTSEDIYFEDSGIRLYDASSQTLKFYKSGYASLQIMLSSSSAGIQASNTFAITTATGDIYIHDDFRFVNGGVFGLRNLGSDPDGLSGAICVVGYHLKFHNGTSWVTIV